MNDKTIVVTGGAGFIGSNLSEALAKDNDVIIVDDLSTGHLGNIEQMVGQKNITFIKGSITDLALLNHTFQNVDYVYHQAAIPSVPRSVKDPVNTTMVNINGTLNVLLAARDNGVKKVIYASSSSAYGDTPVLPKKEDMTPSPLSPYAISKLTGEYYCMVFTQVYGLQTISLRYFNVYGPKQDPKSEYAAVIPKFITKLANDQQPLIYGDGMQTRDFTYVQDVVDANILAATHKATGTVNIAGGKRVTINDLALSVMKLSGKNIKPEYVKPRPGDILHSLADISKAEDQLQYKPKYTLEEGLKETIKWFHI